MSYEYITKFDSPNYTPEQNVASVFGVPRVLSSITVHHWGDPADAPTFSGTISYLCRPNGNSSAHSVIEAGRVASIINHKDASWHAGSALGNATSLGLECNPRASTPDYETVSEYVADLWVAYGKIPLLPHKYWTATACPGAWNLNRILMTANSYYANKTKTKTPVTSPSTGAKYYTVAKGDTLYSIARKFGTTVPILAKLNGIKSLNIIKAGSKLRVS